MDYPHREYREFFVGLDCGQLRDYSAMGVAARRYIGNPQKGFTTIYDIIYLARLKLGTPYPVLVSQVCDFMQDPRLVTNRAILVVEATGVGVGIIQDIRAKGVMARGVWLTSGSSETQNPAGLINLPKVDMVTSLVRVFQTGRIKIAKSLEYAQQFREELEGFKRTIKRSTANMTFEAESEKIHDDLVNAVGIAVWFGENHQKPMQASTIAEARKKDRKRTDEYDPLLRKDLPKQREMAKLKHPRS